MMTVMLLMAAVDTRGRGLPQKCKHDGLKQGDQMASDMHRHL